MAVELNNYIELQLANSRSTAVLDALVQLSLCFVAAALWLFRTSITYDQNCCSQVYHQSLL